MIPSISHPQNDRIIEMGIKMVVPRRNQQSSRSVFLIPDYMLELPRKFFSKY